MVQRSGPSSLAAPRFFTFLCFGLPSTRIGSNSLGATGDRGFPTRIFASSFSSFAAGLSPARSPGELAGPDSAMDGLGATEALSGGDGDLASDAAFATSGLPTLVTGLGAVRAGSGRKTGTLAGA